MQRIARWTVGLGTLLAVAAVALLLVNGTEATFESDALRIAFLLILLAILGVVGAATLWLKAQASRDDGPLDERDKAILGRAEHFHDIGAVPVFYLYLIFWSCVVVDLLGLPVGVLAGYRRR